MSPAEAERARVATEDADRNHVLLRDYDGRAPNRVRVVERTGVWCIHHGVGWDGPLDGYAVSHVPSGSRFGEAGLYTLDQARSLFATLCRIAPAEGRDLTLTSTRDERRAAFSDAVKALYREWS